MINLGSHKKTKIDEHIQDVKIGEKETVNLLGT
jgi:hypothetical protein